MRIHTMLEEAIEAIDSAFGEEGYAKKNPGLLASTLQVSAQLRHESDDSAENGVEE